MRLSVRTAAWIAFLVEVAAFAACTGEYIRLSFFASAASKPLEWTQPFLLGALAALGYGAATVTLYRKGKFLLCSSLGIALVVVLVALKFAYL